MLQLEERERELTHELEATQQEADPLQRQVQLLRVMGAMTARKERLHTVIFFMLGVMPAHLPMPRVGSWGRGGGS